LRIFFSQMFHVSLRLSAQAAFFARIVLWQSAAARRRARGPRRPPRSAFRHFQHRQSVQPSLQGLT
jgi:hypothetical protein